MSQESSSQEIESFMYLDSDTKLGKTKNLKFAKHDF